MQVSATKVKVGSESKREPPRPLQPRKYPVTLAKFGPPLDASGVLTWKLLHSLASQLPSAQEDRGDVLLDDARRLARDSQDFISPSDFEIVRERFTL